MRLSGWRVEGYGVLHALEVSDLPAGLSVVAGPNEAGKSTLLDFLRGVLFGFPDRRRSLPYRAPLRGGRHGGRVDLLDEHGASWTLARWVGMRLPELLGPDGRAAGEAELRDLLGGADGAVFRSVFAFGLGELASFESLGDDAVRDAVFSAGVLGAGRSASAAGRALRQRREALARPRQGDAPANRLHAELTELEAELRAAQRAAEAHPRHAAERARLAEEVGRARAQLERLRRRSHELERLVACWPVRCRAESAREELAALGGPTERATALLAAEQTVERLLAERSGHAERTRRAEQLAAELAELDREREMLLASIGPSLGADCDPRRVRGAGLAADAEALLAEYRSARAALEAACAELERASEELRSVELDARATVAGAAVHLLLEPGPRPLEQLDELELLVVELREQLAARDRARAEHAAAEQALRLAELTAAGPRRLASSALVLLGAAAAGLAAWGSSSLLRARPGQPAGGLIALLAAVLLGAALLVLALLERRRRRADARARREGSAPAVLDAATRRADELVHRLGLGEELTAAELAAFAGRLQLERAERVRLEARARERSRVESAVEAASGRLRARRSELESLLGRSKELGAAAGLASVLGPDGLVRVVRSLEELAELDARRERLARPLEQLQNEIAARLEQVGALLEDLPGRSAVPGGPEEALNALASELRRAVEQRELRGKALRTIDECEEELTRQLGSAGSATALRSALASGDVLAWESERGELDATLERALEAHEAAVAACSAAEHSLGELERSGSVAALELRRGTVLSQLEDTLEEWALLSLAESLLAGTLARYERERQPVVVARAGELFSEVTGGRYQRLIARVDGEGRGSGIDALSAGGERVDCESLSRGTAEQLYLCLRLAYATTFAERAATLPLVLDDVLVNFDPGRARAVAEVVAGVASSHQVLAFTCHPHVVELFTDVAPDARVVELPAS